MKALKKIQLIIFLLFVSVAFNGASGEILSSFSPTAGFVFARDITLGISGNDVSALQQFLIAGGFLKIPAPTGYFGTLTKSALSGWQASLGIYPSAGFFGPVSRRKINSVSEQAPIRLSNKTAPVQITATSAQSITKTTTENSANLSPASTTGIPARLKIPKLNIDASFQYTGLKPDGAMEIPSNIVDAGWFTSSARPGENGTAIITGHVAQIRGGVVTKPGVFSNLSELRPGDKLYVINDKGESIVFSVRESRSYDPTADATDVFASADGKAHLNLITCEGVWNPAKLSYSQRLIVFTDLSAE